MTGGKVSKWPSRSPNAKRGGAQTRGACPFDDGSAAEGHKDGSEEEVGEVHVEGWLTAFLGI